MAERIVWGKLMRLGLGRLQLSPEAFWALTPAELMLMAGLDGGERPMRRADLAALASLYPDTPLKGDQNDGI